MNDNSNRIAMLANIVYYENNATLDYIDGAPHIKHSSLRNLYGELIVQVFDSAKKYNETVRVLDLGAGEGSATLPFLELGAKVVAVDISNSQLEGLKVKCKRFGNLLEVRCEDINETLKYKNEKYDIIVVNSFLHHIPDYLEMINEIIQILTPHGQFFSFQDPMSYDSVGRFNLTFSTLSYFWWRFFKGDVIGGVKRRIRRARGIYLEDSSYDNAEYHVTRNGVDQNAICDLLNKNQYSCNIIKYFSTQSSFFQLIGSYFNIKNTFAIIGKKEN